MESTNDWELYVQERRKFARYLRSRQTWEERSNRRAGKRPPEKRTIKSEAVMFGQLMWQQLRSIGFQFAREFLKIVGLR